MVEEDGGDGKSLSLKIRVWQGQTKESKQSTERQSVVEGEREF